MKSNQTSISDIISSIPGDHRIYGGYCGDPAGSDYDGQPLVHWPSFYFLKSDFQSLAASETFPFDFQGCLVSATSVRPKIDILRPYTAAAEKRETERAIVRCIKNYKKSSLTRTFSKNAVRELLDNKSHRPHAPVHPQNLGRACIWLDWKIIRAIFKGGKEEENDKIVLQNNLNLHILMDKLDEVSPPYKFSPHVSKEFQHANINYTSILWREKQRRETREELEQELVELSDFKNTNTLEEHEETQNLREHGSGKVRKHFFI